VYFHVSAAALSREQAALLAGAIVNPRVLTPRRPAGRLLRRQQIILARMGSIEPPPVEAGEIVPREAAGNERRAADIAAKSDELADENASENRSIP
jgi:membrane peptidoglycan carboxypeptidase